MKMMSHYLIVMLSVLLFIFRLIVLFTTKLGVEFVVHSFSVPFEIIYLFVMLLCIILMTRSKLIGAIIFLASSLLYLGPTLWNQFMYLSDHSATVEMTTQMIVTILCLLVPIAAFFIIAFAKQQEKKPVDKKTDFFYKNENYDRNLDDRADKNNYRTL